MAEGVGLWNALDGTTTLFGKITTFLVGAVNCLIGTTILLREATNLDLNL